MARVVVGLSGGVDSSVTAQLLLEQGHEVIGIFMRNWHNDDVILDDECPWIEDSNDAMLVAEQLGIPFQVIDLSIDYKKRIVDYMFAEYESGRTPNPDVLCNREIKFDLFLDAAVQLGAEYVATGHYCQKQTEVIDGTPVHKLLAGADPGKDQSYFLCQLNQDQLAKALFPIGHLLKSEVREIAERAGLATAAKKDSQGLCFIGKVKLPVFLQQQLEPKPGITLELPADHPAFHPAPINLASRDEADLEAMTAPHVMDPSAGLEVGKHNGAHYYTIGQRKGLHVGGRPLPSFVLDTDVTRNEVYTGQGENHPGLFRRGLRIALDELHWVRPDLALKPGQEQRYHVRIRYRQPLFDATLVHTESALYILFDTSQRSVARGQFAAWYNGEELVGSGVIT